MSDEEGTGVPERRRDTGDHWFGIGAIVIAGLFILSLFFDVKVTPRSRSNAAQRTATTASGVAQPVVPEEIPVDREAVLPSAGVELPVQWGDLGKRLIDKGVIDAEKFESLYSTRGGLTAEDRSVLGGDGNGALRIDARNAPFLLNVLWAFGLANANDILEKGPMKDPQYGGADRFASTGGWTLAEGDAMRHYGAHPFVKLTAAQQELVERVSRNIYRPCCNNSTYFPDCNHGMAMLGLLELMAAQGAGEERMYRTALAVNSYWFPDTYLTLARYFKKRGIEWDAVDPKQALAADLSSASGYRTVLEEVEPVTAGGGEGCGA